MEYVSYTITAVGAVALLAAGVWLGLQDKTASASALLGIAFLLVVVLAIAKFKHVKGFGFEAETWDQKQVEAAELVDQLSRTSEALGQQTVLVASKLGLWDSALSNPELAALAAQQDDLLTRVGLPKVRRDDLLAPVYHRIEMNYANAAIYLLNAAIGNEGSAASRDSARAQEPERSTLTQRVQALETLRQKLNQLTTESVLRSRSLTAVIAILNQSELSDPTAARTLEELDQDLRYFVANRKLRREIDLSYIYK